MYTISFQKPRGATITVGARFTVAQINSLALLFFAEETPDGMFCFEGTKIDKFVEWYATSFPDRDTLEHIVGGSLRGYDSVTMYFEPVLEPTPA